MSAMYQLNLFPGVSLTALDVVKVSRVTELTNRLQDLSTDNSIR